MSRPTRPKRILVIHGPNLNMLGQREPSVYGATTLAQIDAGLIALGKELGLAVECFQSNHEGAIIEKIQSAVQAVAGLIINPAAYTHTSVAIRDALLLLSAPIVEVHLSNVHRRDAFRHRSFVSDVATGQIVGLGAQGYELALRALASVV